MRKAHNFLGVGCFGGGSQAQSLVINIDGKSEMTRYTRSRRSRSECRGVLDGSEAARRHVRMPLRGPKAAQRAATRVGDSQMPSTELDRDGDGKWQDLPNEVVCTKTRVTRTKVGLQTCPF